MVNSDVTFLHKDVVLTKGYHILDVFHFYIEA